MNKKLKWYAVRCLFSHPTRKRDGDGNLYEERILLWHAENDKEAFELATVEAKQYADEAKAIFIETIDSFYLFDDKIKHGTEIWALMRGSNFHAQNYIDTFLDTGRERITRT